MKQSHDRTAVILGDPMSDRIRTYTFYRLDGSEFSVHDKQTLFADDEMICRFIGFFNHYHENEHGVYFFTDYERADCPPVERYNPQWEDDESDIS